MERSSPNLFFTGSRELPWQCPHMTIHSAANEGKKARHRHGRCIVFCASCKTCKLAHGHGRHRIRHIISHTNASNLKLHSQSACLFSDSQSTILHRTTLHLKVIETEQSACTHACAGMQLNMHTPQHTKAAPQIG